MPYQGTNAGAKKELADLGFFEKGTRGTLGTRREGGMFLQIIILTLQLMRLLRNFIMR